MAKWGWEDYVKINALYCDHKEIECFNNSFIKPSYNLLRFTLLLHYSDVKIYDKIRQILNPI
ncbi:hypothetical protein GCM10009111_27890 [Colwellia asteriadis]|uniref:Uncharacterized protein n=1 Tax=Colwellia asteriadis TaxID=517723 RepID=A0ABN1L9K0_9GAMM